ncbi:hypothetical protein H8N03_09810 [Ramlibacter sp. USB13]|uniref:Heat induced stress protein YflT n=1 Tax=Ramlibacter cellulosilyticus TaxID=2764187 RepID=A0A923MRG5_9BURK|nr:hypothetical protein [Ramlibacter cellulosilyticus]MBC5783239.1 hypothetical protein [Ramlibacter cellulosilyticus]
MHTAICAFDTHEQAKDAIASLERAGFARHDLHIEHKHASAEGREANDRWDGMEREIAVDRGVVQNFGHFFASLFGRDEHAGHADTYSQHVERGSHVVVVDAHDEAEARRAQDLLRAMQAGDLNLVHRREQRPLRDIVGMRQSEGTAVNRSNDTYEAAGSFGSPNMDYERAQRAMASNRVSPTSGPDLREPESERAPGLRYSDKDKPV